MSAVNAIIDFKRNVDEDFYNILHCDQNSSVEQIQTEFKILALKLHPDKNKGDKDAEAKFQILKEAKETLCDPEKRAVYDKWLNSGIAMSYKNWLSLKDHVGQSLHWMTPKTKDRMLPNSKTSEEIESNGSHSTLSANRMQHDDSDTGTAKYSYTPDWNRDHSDVTNKFRNYEI